jgi:predicted CoA-binding protein
MKPSTLESAREFLAAGRIAVVGVSRDAKDFSRHVLRELAARGLDVVAVNPALSEADGRPCFARVGDVSPPARAALVLTPPARTDGVVRECIAAGVSRIWLHRGAGAGSATPTALALCAEHGIEPVRDLCPLMALPGTAFPHRLHHAFRRLLARA